jgi:hypothetical protein
LSLQVSDLLHIRWRSRWRCGWTRSWQNGSTQAREAADAERTGYCGGYGDGAAIVGDCVSDGFRHVCGDDI